MGKFISDFKEFAMKGNIIDMAVGVIIGGAFGDIVSSLVNNIIMPLISLMTGGTNFSDMKVVLTEKIDPATGQVLIDEATRQPVPDATLGYGMFIQNIVDFLIIALSIFVALLVIMKFKKKEKEAEAEAAATPPAPSAEETLLTEIRDLLKKDVEKK